MKTKLFLVALLPGLILAALFMFTLAQPAPVQAAGFVVNAHFDDAQAHDASPGDGFCLDLDGACTLRAAIEEANALAGWDTITFANAMTITIDAGVGQLPDITDQLTIDASGVWDTVNSRPGVTLYGQNQSMIGLSLYAPNSEVYGLFLTSFTIALNIRSDNNTIGGPTQGQRNVIAGNSGSGVNIQGAGAHHNVVQGNWIGLNVAGDIKLPNFNGVDIIDGARNNTIGGEAAGTGNYISGNTYNGVYITDSSTNFNRLGGNSIGLSAVGSLDVGNGLHGVWLSNGVQNTKIGSDPLLSNTISSNGGSGVYILNSDTTQVFYNTIAYNSADGVRVEGATATRNHIVINSIHHNGGQGIELLSGGNMELAAPVITSASASGASGTSCALCPIWLYSDSGGQGQTYHGGAAADASGNWSYGGALTGPNITATATDSGGNTSEFSAPKALNDPPFTPSNPSPADSATGVSLTPTLSWSGGDPDGDVVTYTVYGGQSSWVTSTLWYSGTAVSFPLTSLPANTSYTWQVTADDGNGGNAQGAFWEFTTGSASYKLFLPAVLKP